MSAAVSGGLFVRRPVLAVVVNLLILVAGLAAWLGVEVRELPDVDRPVISLTASYPGAAPETVDRQVTSRLEGAAARISGVASISSSSTFGSARVTVEFSDGTDLDVAASDLRDAVGRIRNALPDGVAEPRIVKSDADAQPVMRLSVTSPSMPVEELTVFVEDEVAGRLSAVDGVADVQVWGGRERVFLVDVDQSKLAVRGLTVADLAAAVSSAAFDVPAGALEGGGQRLVVRATSAVASEAAMAAVPLAPGVVVGDVAEVSFAPAPGDSALRADGMTGVGLGVVRQAGSNVLAISEGVRNEIGRIGEILPPGVTLKVTADDAVFVSGALSEVGMTLLASAAVVVLVIFAFLSDWRATLVPAVTMPVALVGTLAAVWLAGFSVNILTLLAVVLAAGLVVDDAIVVLENVYRHRAMGAGARAAAMMGVKEVFFAVIATTATLVAVFVPLSFLPGQTGGLFREFGATLAFAVVLSSFVALSLVPAMASKLLAGSRPSAPDGGAEPARGRAAAAYSGLLSASLSAPLVVVTVALCVTAAAVLSFASVRQELVPQEDRGVVMMRISAPQGSELSFTRDRMAEIEDALAPLRASGEVESLFSVTGMGGSPEGGFAVLALAPWDQRSRSQAEIARDVTAAASSVAGVQAFVMQPNSLRIRGGGSGLQVALVGTDHVALTEAASALVESMEDSALFRQARLSAETSQAQLSVEVDRAAAADLGMQVSGLGQAVQAMVDSRSVGEVFVDGRAYPVRVASSANPVREPADLENVHLRTGDGRVVPLSSVATLVETSVSPRLSREGQSPAVSVSAGLAEGVSFGDALSEAEALAAPLLPPGARVVALSEAAAMAENARGMAVVFGFALVVIFLVLAAQFESFASALIVMAAVPVGLACAVFALLVTGGTLNVYSQIGLVLIVGIMAKNSILVVEFADQLRDRGMDVRRAVEEAAAVRFRPVLMTMVSTVLGALPLVLSTGAGAEARNALGWVIVGGLGMAGAATLFLTPVAYLLVARYKRPRAGEERRLAEELEALERKG